MFSRRSEKTIVFSDLKHPIALFQKGNKKGRKWGRNDPFSTHNTDTIRKNQQEKQTKEGPKTVENVTFSLRESGIIGEIRPNRVEKNSAEDMLILCYFDTKSTREKSIMGGSNTKRDRKAPQNPEKTGQGHTSRPVFTAYQGNHPNENKHHTN